MYAERPRTFALATASNIGIDILVLSEPYRCGLEEEGWFSDIEATAAIVIYKAKKNNAWMIAAIFKDWLINWDKELNRNVLLLIDNCPAHIIDCINLRHIKVIFLPTNTTLVIQPCDQCIIRTFKAYYR